jgi:hypothetical protein
MHNFDNSMKLLITPTYNQAMVVYTGNMKFRLFHSFYTGNNRLFFKTWRNFIGKTMKITENPYLKPFTTEVKMKLYMDKENFKN